MEQESTRDRAWSVSVQVREDDPVEIDVDVICELIDVLAPHHAVASCGLGEYGAQFDVFAADPPAAAAEALRVFDAAVVDVGLPVYPVVHLDVVTVEEQERELSG